MKGGVCTALAACARSFAYCCNVPVLRAREGLESFGFFPYPGTTCVAEQPGYIIYLRQYAQVTLVIRVRVKEKRIMAKLLIDLHGSVLYQPSQILPYRCLLLLNAIS